MVAEAGRAGQVTIATNMAGRGTDIKLTPEVKEAGGLAIVGTSVTSRAVWTVSCAAVRAVRATPVRRSSSYRWRMTSCVCSVRSVSPP